MTTDDIDSVWERVDLIDSFCYNHRILFPFLAPWAKGWHYFTKSEIKAYETAFGQFPTVSSRVQTTDP